MLRSLIHPSVRIAAIASAYALRVWEFLVFLSGPALAIFLGSFVHSSPRCRIWPILEITSKLWAPFRDEVSQLSLHSTSVPDPPTVCLWRKSRIGGLRSTALGPLRSIYVSRSHILCLFLPH
ncbi:hypothetical protein EDB86DRAFT_838027 [Lactarius hatsudake]|nr:hypothetical protein EDB86DRAFT_838027 [Lactarius hatsudake]